MMKKNILLAMTLAVMVSCTSDEFVGDQAVRENNDVRAISFNLNVPTVTRADKTGSAAATDLNKQFYVYAIKNESTDGAGNVGAGNLVFNNYIVKWVDNTAYTTTSNTKNWEYVGYTLSATEQAKITDNSAGQDQTIKYWDYSAADYTFYAFSALPTDISGDKVTVAKVKNKKATDEPAHTVYDNGYTVTLAAGADLDHLFFAERQFIGKTAGTDRDAKNTYGGNVTFRFHNMASKVRVGMYETIPGYSVTINKFFVDNDGADPAFGDMTDDVTANFAANLQNCSSGAAGTLTVKYVSSGTTQNHPTVSFAGTADKAKVLALGTGLKENVVLGTTATGATYDQTAKAYTSVFPNETNTQNLKLKLSYTLTAPVTGETIVVTGKTAEIPAKYLQWKPGFAYTYLFKITDDALYPITFDAVEVLSEDGVAEYITTVTEPSITTFGVKSSKYTTGKDEYEAGTDIYVTITTSSGVVPPNLGTNVNVYVATTTDATNYPVTEASVAESIANPGASPKVTCTLINTDATTYFTAEPAKATEVPREDSGYISTSVDLSSQPVGWPTGYYTDERCTTAATTYSNGTYYQKWTDALKLTGVKNPNTPTYYVIEYIDGGNKTYKVIKVVAGS